MNLAHRILLIPTCSQAAYFKQACGTKRFVWNEALRAWNDQFACAAEAAKAASVVAKTEGLRKPTAKRFVKAAIDEVGGWPKTSVLKATFNEHKYYAFPWLEDIHRDAHSQPFADLSDAFVRFRKGLAKRPKFKKKHRCRDSFYVANDKFEIDGKTIRLPIVGGVKLSEALRFTGKIMSATVSRTADKWFVSVSVETDTPRPVKFKKDGATRCSAAPLLEDQRRHVIGVDLGILHAVVTSAGVVYDAPKPLKHVLAKLRRLQRSQARRLTAGRKAFPKDKNYRSQNWKKGNQQLARLHTRAARIRIDFVHKTTTDICRENQAVVIEDLNVKGMLRNHCLARALSEAMFGEIRRQLAYKADIYGTRLLVADRWLPSSKKCSRCGVVGPGMDLSQRTFKCAACGLKLDRDLNASLNLENEYPRLEGNRHLRTGRRGSPLRSGKQPSLVETGTGRCALVHT